MTSPSDCNPLAQLDRARRKREPLRATGTDALRLVDGEGDGFEDLIVEDFAGHWLAQTRGDSPPMWLAGQPPHQNPDHQNPDRKGGAPPAPFPVSLYWKKLDQKEKRPPEWLGGGKVEEPFVARENGVGFWIDFQSGYSQGLFLDQRENRARLHQVAGGRRVLNCFAYTCGFSVVAARADAETTSIDLSKSSLEWGKRNFILNGLDPDSHRFVRGDVFDWLGRFAKREEKFDIIVLDPPTFSRGESRKVFRVEKDFPSLVALTIRLLTDTGTILCSTNQRSLNASQFGQLVLSGTVNPRAWRLTAAPMPPDFTGEKYLKSAWLTRGP